MQYIENLGNYLDATPGSHVVLTGTFDPPHRGHVVAVEEALDLHKDARSAVVIPHNWNTNKAPVLSFRDRVRAVSATFDGFGSDLVRPVVVSVDPLSSQDVDGFIRTTAEFRDRLIRTVGNDESDLIRALESDGWRVVLGRRSEGLSSTDIKKKLSESGAVADLGEFVRGEVLEQLRRSISTS